MAKLLRWQTLGWIACAALIAVRPASGQELPYGGMADRIVAALQVERGESVLVRYDPETMGDLAPEVADRLQRAGARVELLRYGSAPGLAATLEQVDVYIWLPAGPSAPTGAEQRAALADWLDRGRGRQVHFHWIEGTRDLDGLPGPHSSAYDAVYVDALDIDYAALRSDMDRAIDLLRSGEVRVTTPAGTDVRFRVGNRPFNRQDGDASRARQSGARIRIDRETELPAGVLRVAPIESSVNGTIVLPFLRVGETRVTDARLVFEAGKIVRATAATNESTLKEFLSAEPGSSQFREFAVGFNPKLVVPSGERLLPYYGYGAGVIRMSLGDNAELGGAVRGGGVRWLFFDTATVKVGDRVLVQSGKLAR